MDNNLLVRLENSREASSAQKHRMKRLVCRVTGSVKSPPGGETAPMTLMLAVRSPKVRTLPSWRGRR